MSDDSYEPVFKGAMMNIVSSGLLASIVAGVVLSLLSVVIGFISLWMVYGGAILFGVGISSLFAVGWKNTTYKVKSKVLLKKVNISSGENTSVIQYRDVTGIRKQQSLWERFIGVGSIVIKTNETVFKVEFIREWEDVYDDLVELCDIDE